MGIYKVDNSVEIRLGEEDVVVVVAETLQGNENQASLILAEYSEEDIAKKEFPYVIDGKPILDAPHISITFENEEQIDKLIRMLEVQKEAIREMNAEQGLAKMMEDSE